MVLQMSSAAVGAALPCNSRAPRLEVSNTSKNRDKIINCGVLATTRRFILLLK